MCTTLINFKIIVLLLTWTLTTTTATDFRNSYQGTVKGMESHITLPGSESNLQHLHIRNGYHYVILDKLSKFSVPQLPHLVN